MDIKKIRDEILGELRNVLEKDEKDKMDRQSNKLSFKTDRRKENASNQNPS